MALSATKLGPVQITNVTSTLLTVPAGEKAIIRHIRLLNQSGSTQGVSLSIGLLASGNNQIRSATFTLVAGQAEDIWGPFVLDAADVIQGATSVGGGMVFTCAYDRVILG